MSSTRRLHAALDSYVSHRQGGARSKRHVVPLVNFAEAELKSRGMLSENIQREIKVGRLYQRKVDLAVSNEGRIVLVLFIVTQSGSVRNNLNNRRRETVADLINMRLANPWARLGFIYLLRADEEATKKGKAGTSPVDEIALFLDRLQSDAQAFGRPLAEAAALLAADRDANGKIHVERVAPGVDITNGFFERLTTGLVKQA